MEVNIVKSIPINESIGVACVMINKKTHEIYLSQRKGEYEHNKFCCPGGMVEPDESYISAMMRELYEETGISLTADRFRFINIVQHDGAKSNYTVWFKTYLYESEIPLNLEVDKHGDWLPYNITDAVKFELMLSTKEILTKFI